MHSHTVLTAADVRRLARHAQAAGLNQQLSDYVLTHLDPGGFSIMSMELPFHNIDYGGPVHHRVTAYLKMRNTTDPEEAIMDVLADDWEKLPEAVSPE